MWPLNPAYTTPRRYYGLNPDIKVIAPWREWDLLSRTKLIEYAEANSIPVPAAKRGEPPFSMDANLLHISYEGYTLNPLPSGRSHIIQLKLDILGSGVLGVMRTRRDAACVWDLFWLQCAF